MDIDFRDVGGVQTVRDGADPADPDAVEWNFGVAPTTPEVVADAGPELYARLPNVQGRWDGKSIVNHHLAVFQVLGRDLKAQYQRAGTCGGRAGSRGLEILQCIMIATGKRASFNYVSHAWPYYLARREYRMLGSGDGVPSGAVPPVLAKYGALNREESEDTDADSDATDKLAVKWGAGKLTGDVLEKMTLLASDNIVTGIMKVSSAEELADGIAAGGIGIGSDSQGYSMIRDGEGFCSPKGTWHHYHIRSGVFVNARGRKGFIYDQSWGDHTPSGPQLPGCPGNCFAVDWDVQDRCCRKGDYHVVFAFDLWNLEQGNTDVPWTF